MNDLHGKVVVISGVARGQGRCHAVRLAERGADVIGFDICADIASVEAPLATPEDLAETVAMVEKAGGRIVARVQDVRDADGVARVIDEGVAEFGRLDIVLANAGIFPVTGEQAGQRQAWVDAVDTMVHGVYNTVTPSIPHLLAHGDGGSIVITSSTGGLTGFRGSAESPGLLGYVVAKHSQVGMMRAWAGALASAHIRVNTIHPTAVRTPMVVNDATTRQLTAHPHLAATFANPLPTGDDGMIDAEDVTNQVLHLVSDAGRYITGSTVTVDAGYTTG